MSWDLAIVRIRGKLRPIKEVKGRDYLPLGDLKKVRAAVSTTFPSAEWSSPTWAFYANLDFSIEIDLEGVESAKAILLHVHGSGDPIPSILKLTEANGWLTVDGSSGQFIDPANPSYEGWQGYKDLHEQAICDMQHSRGEPTSPSGKQTGSVPVLRLRRFDSFGKEVPKRPDILQRLERVARKLTKKAGQKDAVSLAADGASLDIKLPGGVAKVHPTSATFPIKELDPLTMQVVFEIARAGDMVILAERGYDSVILTNRRQYIPMDLIGDGVATDCSSLENLESKLKKWYAVQTGAISHWRQYPSEAEWIPGTSSKSPASFLYVEARPRETAGIHQKKVYRHHQQMCKDGRFKVDPQERGMMMADFWRLETPASQVFYAYSFGGVKEKWLAMFRDFVAAENRATGWIENFDTFVQDDGRRFPLGDCGCMKVRD